MPTVSQADTAGHVISSDRIERDDRKERVNELKTAQENTIETAAASDHKSGAKDTLQDKARFPALGIGMLGAASYLPLTLLINAPDLSRSPSALASPFPKQL